jgi:tetratricopeptide (TPR) repeat protein
VSAAVGLRLVRQRMAIAWALALTFGVVASHTAGIAFRTLPRPRPLEELSYYPSGRHLEPATLGHSESAADLAWLRAVQYYGEHRATDNRFDRMYHVFDILTSLAPAFVPGYVFGAFALAQEGNDFPRAEQLMLKGVAANPRSGALAFQLGFLYYVRPGGRDMRHAAEYFQQASRQSDAPPQSARFAAYARQQSGDLQVAYELWSEVRRNSPNHYLRDIAERELRRIRAAIEQGRKDLAADKLGTPVVTFR